MSQNIPKELENYRKEIDAIDVELIDLLARRFKIVRAVGKLKARENMEVVQHDRAIFVKQNAIKMGEEKGLRPELIAQMYDTMIDHAHILENEIMKSETSES